MSQSYVTYTAYPGKYDLYVMAHALCLKNGVIFYLRLLATLCNPRVAWGCQVLQLLLTCLLCNVGSGCGQGLGTSIVVYVSFLPTPPTTSE